MIHITPIGGERRNNLFYFADTWGQSLGDYHACIPIENTSSTLRQLLAVLEQV